MNSHIPLFLPSFMEDRLVGPLTTDELKLFRSVGIPHYLQHICFRYMADLRNSTMLKVQMGLGKSSLCMVLALHFSITNKQTCFVINQTEDLAFRDFKKVSTASRDLDVKISFVSDEEGNSEEHRGQIVYFTLAGFENYLSRGDRDEELKETIILLDEFDQLIFDNPPPLTKKLVIALNTCNFFLGLTGSTLTIWHFEFFFENLKCMKVEVPILAELEGKSTLCLGTSVFRTKA
jgi:hypothetical protein